MAICIFVMVSGLIVKLLSSVDISFWNLLIGTTVLIALIFALKLIFAYYRQLYFSGIDSIFLSPFVIYSKPKSQLLPILTKKLSVGDTLIRDFRDKSAENKKTTQLKIVSFNIEKGRKIDAIIKLFQSLDADIYCLQEVDINTQRANYVDILGEIGSELKLNTLFCCEQIINKKQATMNGYGYEGNAVLSKYDFIDTNGLIIDCVRTKHKHERGRHTECASIIKVNGICIGVYSLHLEPHYCGVDGRISQYLQILENVKQQRIENKLKYQILCGDFNTVCTGIARLNFVVSPDLKSMIGTLGMSESEYFNCEAVNYGNLKYDLDFRDPFHKVNDFTFYSFKGLFKAKLDWCLLSKSFKVIAKCVGDVDHRCSDHQWVMVQAISVISSAIGQTKSVLKQEEHTIYTK